MKDHTPRYIGLGPMVLTPASMIGNQHRVVQTLLERIAAAAAFSGHSGPKSSISPHNVLSIIAGRGAGKTSILMTTLEKARGSINNAIITDLIRPDLMRPDFPILPSIIHCIEMAIQEQCPAAWKQAEDAGEPMRLRQAAWSLAVKETFRVLARDTLSLREWDSRLFDLLARPVDLVAEFHGWLSKILGRTERSVIVIPIDDADIAIDKAEELVETVRTFLAVEKIVVIMACDLHALERRIRNSRLNALPHPPIDSGGKEPLTYILGMTGPEFQMNEAQEEQSYVEALLAKVLPPAMRFYLSLLTPEDRLYTAVVIPGRGRPRAVHAILEEVDAAAPADRNAVSISPLFEAHPQILSDNLRLFINQVAIIADVCDEYCASLQNHTESDLESEYDRYLRSMRTSPADAKLMAHDNAALSALAVKDGNDLRRGKLHMSLTRSVLTRTEFSAFIHSIYRAYGRSLLDIGTMHDLVAFLWHRVSAHGSSDDSLRYTIGGYRQTSPTVCRLLDFCLDWAIARGIRPYDVIENLSIPVRSGAFRPIPLPRRLARRIRKAALSDIEPNVRLEEKALEGYFAAQVVVPVDRDRLWPSFVGSMSGIGRYYHWVINYPRMERYERDATAFLRALDTAKTADVSADDIKASFMRVLGLIAVQTLYHISALEVEVMFKGDRPRATAEGPLHFVGDSECAWLVIDLRGVLETMAGVIESASSLCDVFLILSYLADLPTRVLLGCVQDEGGVQTDRVIHMTKTALDRLQSAGLITGRDMGSDQIGRWIPEQAPDLLEEVRARHGYIDFDRRAQAIRRFLQGFQVVDRVSKWDRRSSSPPQWSAWFAQVRRRNARKKESKNRPSKASIRARSRNPRG